MFEYQPGIIVALDIDDIEEVRRIAEEIKDMKREIAGLKIGSLLSWKYSLPKVAEMLKEVCNFPLIFDAQKAGTDIPDMVRRQVKMVADSGMNSFIAAPQGAGEVTLAAFVDACNEYQIVPIVVIEMTHPGFYAFLLKDAAERILEKSIELGVSNFVAPANKPERLKAYKSIAYKKGKEIRIFSPGVGPQGGSPDAAVEAGVDFVIIGRSIYLTEEPKAEVRDIYNLILRSSKHREPLLLGQDQQ